MPRTLLRLVPLVLLAALAGCDSGNAADPTVGLIAAPVSPVLDIPIPAGFHLESDSQTYNAGPIRMAHHHYKGGDDYLSVTRFFREQLPLKGWTLLSQRQDGETVVLSFTKPTEDLSVTVKQGVLNTHAYIKLDPSNRNAAPR